jgi:hypothetical protein
MTHIKIEIPANDPIALNAFSNALREMSHAHDTVIASQMDNARNVNVKLTETHTVGDMSHTTVTEPVADIDRSQLESYGADCSDDVYGESTATDNTESIDDALQATSEFDEDGLPWDERVHSSSKKRNADNTWKSVRKPKDLNDDEWAQRIQEVKNELLSLHAVEVTDRPTPPETVEADPTPPTPPTPPVTEPTPPETVEADPTPPTPPVTEPTPPVTEPTLDELAVADLEAEVIPTPPTPPVTEPMTFPQFMKFLTTDCKKLGNDRINEIFNVMLSDHDVTLATGTPAVTMFAKRLDLIPEAIAALREVL